METNSGDENSNDGLQIVIESPRPKKRHKKELDESDKRIIQSVEKDIEDNLEEKAAKANLTVKHVKNIIKEVVTNEHVLALVRQAENPDESYESLSVYEPKYTRAKTRELCCPTTPQKIPWISTPKVVSEVQMLFTQDLQEDSSGDEYVPECPSRKSSSNAQLNISACTTKDEEEANIALRTRSKLCLSHTPLEVIEEAFMPPDITTDMYDMDCDDDVWKEFLKTYTQPLDEVTKAAEDEDHDPEYNILADEEIDKIDTEELRDDRAVNVSRKELNCLMAELYEFSDMYESNRTAEKSEASNHCAEEPEKAKDDNNVVSDSENDPYICIKKCQIPILAQQMRQHVQMLTQNFLLAYRHPEYAYQAEEYKDMLNDVVSGTDEKDASIYHATNLQPAIKLIEYWEKLYSSQDKEVVECKRYVEKVLVESKNAKLAAREYIVTFPQLLMKTIVNSEVFFYPDLLPRIPFRSFHVTRAAYKFFTNGEDNLIALFLEQVSPHLKKESFHLTYNKQGNLKQICELLSVLLMPDITPEKLLNHIQKRRDPKCGENPINYFYRTKKAPPIVHYAVSVDAQDMLPPCKRSPDTLPYQWREYMHPSGKNETSSGLNNNAKNPVIILSSPAQFQPVYSTNVLFHYNINVPQVVSNRQILPKTRILPDPVFSRKKKRKLNIRKDRKTTDNIPVNKFIERVKKIHYNMLPDMPSLGSTPEKTDNTKVQEKDVDNNKEQNLSFKNIANHSLGFQFCVPDAASQVKRNFESISAFSSSSNKDGESNISSSTEKDNLDDINELMKASSTVKNAPKMPKMPSGAEKKRAKIRREFVTNLRMATPDNLPTQNQKEDDFVGTFFDKLGQTLSVEDYDKVVDILGHYDQNTGEFLDLFKNVQSILYPNYNELYEEFFLFLTEFQAHKVGQLMPYLMMRDMNRFLKKLQVYFKDQPSQMKKIIKCITDLSENSVLTMETIKTNLLPLFKGNVALTDWFLQVFPSEKPPKLVTTGPHDFIDLSKERGRQPGEDICETVVLPDTEDPYGGSSCICTCHNVEDTPFKSRSQHCKKCGLKFMQGKIYIQTGKLLRPAVVSFLTNPEKDHLKRLTAAQRKRSDTSPTKPGVSPTKETNIHEDLRHRQESEDENKKKSQKPKAPRKQRKVKTPQTVKVKKPRKPHSKETSSKTKSGTPKGAKSLPKRQSKKKTTTKKINMRHKPGSTPGQRKRLAEEPEPDCSEPTEPVDLKLNSEQRTESGSELFGSSQDITEGSVSSPHVSMLEQIVPWSREEDKIILQEFRQSSNSAETFKRIARMLENRSVSEIKNRLNKLMTLLQQMAAK